MADLITTQHPSDLARGRVRRLTLWVALFVITGATLTVAVIAVLRASSAVRDLNRMQHELTLRDHEGRPRLRLQAASDGGSVELLDASGVSRVAIKLAADHDATITMQRTRHGEVTGSLVLQTSLAVNQIIVSEPQRGSELWLSSNEIQVAKGSSQIWLGVFGDQSLFKLKAAGRGQMTTRVTENKTVTLLDGEYSFHGDHGLHFGNTREPGVEAK